MPHPWEASLQHDRLGRETLRTMTGGVECAMQYDGVGRPSRQSVTRGGHSLYDRGYRWDDDFQLSHAHDAISGRGRVISTMTSAAWPRRNTATVHANGATPT